jgi:hypothetical protein
METLIPPTETRPHSLGADELVYRDELVQSASTKKLRNWRIRLPNGPRWTGRVALGVGVLVALVVVRWGYGLYQAQTTVLEMANQGVSSANLAAASFKEGNAAATEESLLNSELAFRQALDELSGGGRGIALELGALVGATEGVSAKHLLAGTEELLALSREVYSTSLGTKSAVSLPERVSVILESLPTWQTKLSRISAEWREVDEDDLPAGVRARFLFLQEKTELLSASLKFFSTNLSVLQDVAGMNGPRKYLLLIQNNHELRATGGFIGTYGLLELGGSKFDLKIDGIYNPDGQFRDNIIPPKPLQKITAAWTLHDSNWWADFPTSARQAMRFFEQTGNPTVDGVVAIDPEILGVLLAITGPIELPEYGVTVDSSNYLPILQESVEVKYDKIANTPKKIIGDLAVEILKRLLVNPVEKSDELVAGVLDLLGERHIQLYSTNAKAQDDIQNLGWGGESKDTSFDYLRVVHSNINGYKTDGVVDRDYTLKTRIGDDGSVTNVLTITKKHTGGGTPYEWWNKVNVDYLRVYVPLGSTLVRATGLTPESVPSPVNYDALQFKRDNAVVVSETTQSYNIEGGVYTSSEQGKTTFAGWMYVSPGEQGVVTLEYTLPFRLTRSEVWRYSLFWQKQAGLGSVPIEYTVDYPDDWSPLWHTGNSYAQQSGFSTAKTTLQRDRFYGMIWE